MNPHGNQDLRFRARTPRRADNFETEISCGRGFKLEIVSFTDRHCLARRDAGSLVEQAISPVFCHCTRPRRSSVQMALPEVVQVLASWAVPRKPVVSEDYGGIWF
jgi:hypothetical protein